MKFPFSLQKRCCFYALLSLVFMACETKTDTEEPNKVEEAISSIKNTYAPDTRVTLFDIEVIESPEGYTLKGGTSLPEALDALRKQLEQEQIAFQDSIELLPSASLEGNIYGAIALSVANLRSRPAHSAEMVTQGTLGMPVNVYQKQGSWYRIQTPDHYLGWVDSKGIELMDKTRFEDWQGAEKLIYTKTYGHAFAEANAAAQVVSDLVAGNILKLIGEDGAFYQVEYPDGKNGFVAKSEASPYQDWKSSLSFTKEALVETSKTMLGVPYLWGGTSTKGVDCSGFTKTVYFMNGMIIPRDASQQIHEGTLIDDSREFDKLIPGDLLFFGRKATDSTSERVVHVGMWIGNNEFIHSAGNVHISSMDKSSDNFDAYNYERYLRTKRILNQKDEGLLYLTEQDVF
ncbi:SH3 domain-containing C40 family peptidase [Flagellimonas baculiformis]|uniref:SH3 domain-containing C40 family peptidase n=1 Tax=Flagellimonas baculiformis TaxID=3067310 RepID=UPI00296FDB01|nr:SH3 domain-containing C40 family peptidase [Muricauda sp. D6]